MGAAMVSELTAQPVAQPAVAPVEMPAPAPAEIPTVNEAAPVQPEIPSIDAVQAITPEPVSEPAPAMPEVQPVEQPTVQSVEQPTVQPVTEPAGNTAEINQEDLETPEALNLEKTTVSIYGGANPLEGTQNLTPVDDVAKPIYGGANPDDNKQNEKQAHTPSAEMPASAAPSIPMEEPTPAPQAEPVKVETTETIEQL